MDTTIPQDTPKKQCKDCKAFFPATTTYFYPASGNKDGLLTQCMECRTKYMSARYALKHPKPEKLTPPEGQKFCIKCDNPKPIDAAYFKPSKICEGGFQNVCRACVNQQDTEVAVLRAMEHPLIYSEERKKICTGCGEEFPKQINTSFDDGEQGVDWEQSA